MATVYDELVDFIAVGSTPDAVARFEPSQQTKNYVAELIHKEKAAGLTPEESSELDHSCPLSTSCAWRKPAQEASAHHDERLSLDLRRLVAARAYRLCEYCLIHEEDAYVDYQVEHIIAEKYGVSTEAENLTYACALCNRTKGSDVRAISSPTSPLIRFSTEMTLQ